MNQLACVQNICYVCTSSTCILTQSLNCAQNGIAETASDNNAQHTYTGNPTALPIRSLLLQPGYPTLEPLFLLGSDLTRATLILGYVREQFGRSRWFHLRYWRCQYQFIHNPKTNIFLLQARKHITSRRSSTLYILGKIIIQMFQLDLQFDKN